MQQDFSIYNKISIYATRRPYIQYYFNKYNKIPIYIYSKFSLYTIRFLYKQQGLTIFNKSSIYTQHDVYEYNNISCMYNKNYIDVTRFLYLWQQGCYGYTEIWLYIYVKIRDIYVKIPINTTRLQHINHDYIH